MLDSWSEATNFDFESSVGRLDKVPFDGQDPGRISRANRGAINQRIESGERSGAAEHGGSGMFIETLGVGFGNFESRATGDMKQPTIENFSRRKRQ